MSPVEVRVPGDKSISHRALLLAAAAEGESRIVGLLDGGDCRSTAAVLRQLGCAIPELHDGELRIHGRGLAAWRAPDAPLDCGNSGTTARLLLGLLAGRPFCATLTGDASLRSRPMRRVTRPLAQMGARLRELGEPDRLPVEVCGGPLAGGAHRSEKASAQVKSALLLAGLSARTPVAVWEPQRSRDHTERMLQGLGVEVRAAEEAQGWRVALPAPPATLPPLDLTVPGDPSSAAFLVAAALLGGDADGLLIRGVGVNPTRTGFVRALARMGGAVEYRDEHLRGGEPVADLFVRPARLAATEIGAAEVPALIDELPILAVLAARAEGVTRISGAAELRAKESDRIAVLVANLRALGVAAEELPDGLEVQGSDRPLRGRVHAHDDHRIAMAFGVLAALPGSAIEIDTPQVAQISFPGFWPLLRRLSARAAGGGA